MNLHIELISEYMTNVLNDIVLTVPWTNNIKFLIDIHDANRRVSSPDCRNVAAAIKRSHVTTSKVEVDENDLLYRFEYHIDEYHARETGTITTVLPDGSHWCGIEHVLVVPNEVREILAKLCPSVDLIDDYWIIYKATRQRYYDQNLKSANKIRARLSEVIQKSGQRRVQRADLYLDPVTGKVRIGWVFYGFSPSPKEISDTFILPQERVKILQYINNYFTAHE